MTGSLSAGRSRKYPYYHCYNRSCKKVSIRKQDLERGFVDYLTRLQPKPEYVKLFRAIVLDVWQQKQAEAMSRAASLTQKIEALHEQEQILHETFIYQKAIDQLTYEKQRDKLREKIAVAEMDAHAARLDELDVEAVLAFAEHVLANAARLWLEFSLEQKQRFQKVVFPQGVRFSDGKFRTDETCLMFRMLESAGGKKATLATLPGIEPGLPP